jgi:Copper type II ascorbate-dependent monooxygenase, C-terminal domain
MGDHKWRGRTGAEVGAKARSWSILVGALVLVASAITFAGCSTDSSGATPTTDAASSRITTITLSSPSYRPKAPPGDTDDYHCTLLNPHLKVNSYVISSHFFAGSPEDHHAGLFLLPPSLVAEAEKANVGGKGWTCFGEAGLPNEPINEIGSTPFLSVWAPGHGVDKLPNGTGIELPAGTMVIMQVHYNLLVGDKPVTNRLVVQTVPMSTPLLPLKLDLSFAAPDIPCPSGVTGPLCNRAASLAHQGQEFGPTAITFVNAIEAACGRNPSDPPAGDTTSCTFPASSSGYIVRAQAHMHLLGQSFQLVLNPGTPQAETVLNVPDYNFHYQKAYNLAKPVHVTAGEPLQVTCTYDPTVAQELPILRKAPPHFVTWGDGSSDEMCLGLSWISATLPNPHSPF